MTRTYPDERAGPYDPPPRRFEDGDRRDIRVERYDQEDFEDVVSMYTEFDPEDRAQGIPPTKESAIRDWLESVLGEDCHNVLARHDGHIVGHATLVPDGEDAYELAIFVLGPYQGAGIGTELLEGLLGHGREQGVERVWLTVERWNTPAIRLYEKVGFESTGSGSFEREMAARLN